jgi:hypothetical protein
MFCRVVFCAIFSITWAGFALATSVGSLSIRPGDMKTVVLSDYFPKNCHDFAVTIEKNKPEMLMPVVMSNIAYIRASTIDYTLLKETPRYQFTADLSAKCEQSQAVHKSIIINIQH